MFEWDDEKNRINLEKHGISFEEACLIFNGSVLTITDDRNDYGEVRKISVGMIQEILVVAVVHTDRNDKTRIISARLANRRERKLYNAHG